MFGFGGLSEVLFILFLAMLIFGPAKMPEIARMLAKGMAEVRKASNELKRTLNAELAISEQEKEAARLHSQAAVPFPPPPPAPPAWSGGQTVPQLDATAAAPEASAPASEGTGDSAAAGSSEGATNGAAGSGEGAASGAVDGSKDATSNEGPMGSEVAPSSDDAALTTDAAYYAAWPEDGSSPHAAADAASPERAATTATAAPDGQHTA